MISLFQGRQMTIQAFWGFSILRGTFFAHDKDYRILGSMLGSHYFGELPFQYLLRHRSLYKYYSSVGLQCRNLPLVSKE